jgi:hypothetical protein
VVGCVVNVGENKFDGETSWKTATLCTNKEVESNIKIGHRK